MYWYLFFDMFLLISMTYLVEDYSQFYIIFHLCFLLSLDMK